MPNRHDGAVVLRLGGGSPYVGKTDGAFAGQQLGGGKIGNVGPQTFFLQSDDHIRLVHQTAPGQVNDPGPFFHNPEFFRVQNSLGGIAKGNVDSHVVRLPQQTLQGIRSANHPGQAPRRVHGNKGIIADHVHPQGNGIVGHHDPDGPQTDNPQGFAFNFGTFELGLSLFHQLGYLIPPVCQGGGPGDPRNNTPG